MDGDGHYKRRVARRGKVIAAQALLLERLAGRIG
jgi:hypothetical protein